MKTTILSTILAAALVMPASAATLHREVTASPGETLTVELIPGGAIQVVGWDRNAVVVDADVPGEGDVTATRSSNGVTVTHRAGAGRHVNFRIQVPRKYDLDLETNVGAITIEGVEGSIRGATRAGALSLSRVRGKLKVTTNGGEVTVRDSVVDGSITTLGGQVLLENVDGGVKAHSMGGNVTSRQTGTASASASPLDLSTMGGHVVVERAPGGANLSTMGGNITVRSSAKGVKAKTMGGNISLQSIDGPVDANTMGGDVAVGIAGGAGPHDVTIESKGGDVELTLPAAFAMDADIEIAVTNNAAKRYEIQSDFPLNVTTGEGGHARQIIRGRGQTGNGANKVRIRTINGDVKVKKG